MSKERRRKWLSISASVVLWWVSTCPTFMAADASVPRPSAAKIDALKRLAASKPCAAAALLYILRSTRTSDRGKFYLNGMLSPQAIEFLSESEDGDVSDFTLQPNIYADAAVYIEVQWSVEELGDKSIIISTQAQLVDVTGVQLKPAHRVELPTRVLMVGETLRLLGPSSTL